MAGNERTPSEAEIEAAARFLMEYALKDWAPTAREKVWSDYADGYRRGARDFFDAIARGSSTEKAD